MQQNSQNGDLLCFTEQEVRTSRDMWRRVETRRDESSHDLSPLFRGLCGRSMKPEGCFSSSHAEAALWSEQSTNRRLFGKEQATTQSTPQKL
eukprot:s694_g23.t1